MLRAYGAEVVVCPTAVAPEDPRLLLLGLRPAGPRDRRAPGSPTSTPTRTTRARTTRRPARRSGSRPRAGSPTSSPASAPAARSAAPAATSRRSPTGGCRSSAPTRRARSTPAAPGGRTSSRASARTSGRRPTTATISDEIIAVSDARLVRDDPAAGPRGGPAGRRLVRDGGRRGAARWPRRLGPDDVVVVLLPDGGRGYLSKIFNDDWMARLRLPDAAPARRRSATCCAAEVRRDCRRWCTPTRNETVRDAIDILREYGVSQMPVVQRRAAGDGRRGGRLGVRARPARRAVHRARPRLADAVERHMSPPLPMIGVRRAGDRGGRARWRRPTRCSCTSTASRPACSPARTCSATWRAGNRRSASDPRRFEWRHPGPIHYI